MIYSVNLSSNSDKVNKPATNVLLKVAPKGDKLRKSLRSLLSTGAEQGIKKWGPAVGHRHQVWTN